MRVLVAGAAGFIGSYICDRFLAEGHDVLGVDNFTTGSRDNIAHLIPQRGFHFLEHNTAQFTYVRDPLEGILDFAHPSAWMDYQDRPISSLEEMMLGVHRTLELARFKEARYLLASSCEVYGDPELSPQGERYPGVVDPVSAHGIFAEARRFSESMTAAYHSYHGIDTRIARIFNVYGPRMRVAAGSAIGNFLLQALRGEPLTVYGDGEQTRSFCYIDDMIEGLWRLFFSDHVEPINLGGGEVVTINQLARTIIEVTQSSSEIVHLPVPHPDARSRHPDLTRATEIFGWRPQLTLREGLERCLPYFQEMISVRGSVPRTPVRITGFL